MYKLQYIKLSLSQNKTKSRREFLKTAMSTNQFWRLVRHLSRPGMGQEVRVAHQDLVSGKGPQLRHRWGTQKKDDEKVKSITL